MAGIPRWSGHHVIKDRPFPPTPLRDRAPHRVPFLLLVRFARWLLWLLVASGPIALMLLAGNVWTLRAQVEGSSQPVLVSVPPDTAATEGFAELLVAEFLEAGSASVSAPGQSRDSSTDEAVWQASRTISLGAQEVRPGHFAVTVAVDLLAKEHDSHPETWASVGTRYYTVGVVETDSGLAAAGLPALVAGPRLGSAAGSRAERMESLHDLPALADTVARFVSAYLTGEGDLSRYTTPGSDLVPIHPAPFTTVEVADSGSDVSVDGVRHVLAVVEGSDGTGRMQTLEYALTVAERDGRWEVVELLPVPLLAMTESE